MCHFGGIAILNVINRENRRFHYVLLFIYEGISTKYKFFDTLNFFSVPKAGDQPKRQLWTER